MQPDQKSNEDQIKLISFWSKTDQILIKNWSNFDQIVKKIIYKVDFWWNRSKADQFLIKNWSNFDQNLIIFDRECSIIFRFIAWMGEWEPLSDISQMNRFLFMENKVKNFRIKKYCFVIKIRKVLSIYKKRNNFCLCFDEKKRKSLLFF